HMNQHLTILALTMLVSVSGNAQSTEVGPYTVHEINDHIYRIEDANSSNPAGVTLGDDGQMVSMNNCSDMYLILGGTKGLLIDLSNQINRDPSATTSLRKLVDERLGDRQLVITVTHNHGDHLGMLPAFVNDPEVRFWISRNEFEGRDLFPEGRTTYFLEGASLDLGNGLIVNTLEVPGHTAHSTLFIPWGENLLFSGDAIGSGSGVWLFDEPSFYVYKESIAAMIAYIEDPGNHVDPAKLRIYGGHYWQGSQSGELTWQYIEDMRTLILEMKKGTAAMEEMSAFIPFLNTNFKFGTATITWNREAARRFADSTPNR
ncbi:MAG: MBL fold metallo-hydrolase, partial [Bacteroidales bacterium]